MGNSTSSTSSSSSSTSPSSSSSLTSPSPSPSSSSTSLSLPSLRLGARDPLPEHKKRTNRTIGYETLLSLSRMSASASNQRTLSDAGADIILISTLPEDTQGCLIPQTVACHDEERWINDVLERKKQGLYTVIVYGANHLDATVDRKCAQMRTMGFRSVHAYLGGMFEWLLLHEVFGEENFPVAQPSRSGVPDILAFRPRDGEERASSVVSRRC